MADNLTPKEEFLLNPVEEHNITDAAIASFETNFKHPVKVTVPITPQQDLHGMPYPYPAGASVNLIPDTTDTSNGYVNGYILNSTGNTQVSSNYYISEYFPVIEGETYTWSVPRNPSTSIAIVFYDENKDILEIYNSGTALVQTIVAPQGSVYARSTQYKINGEIAQLELGETATSPRLYSNICPIEGYTGATIYHTGANLLNGKTAADILKNRKSAQVSLNEDADGKYVRLMTMSGADINLTETLKFKENTRYTIILTGKNEYSGASSTHIRFIYSDGNSTEIYWSAPTEIKTIAVTSAANKTVKAITTLTRSYNTRIYYEKPFGLFEGVVSASSFEEYQGITLPISWKHAEGTYNFEPIQAGEGDPSPDNVRPISPALILTRDDNSVLTVYGGSITFRDDGTSILTEKYGSASLTGAENWSWAANPSNTNPNVNVIIANMASLGNSPLGMANYAKTASGDTETLSIRFGWNNKQIYLFKPQDYLEGVTDLESFKAYLLEHPLQIVFPLATLNTYVLSQAETQRVVTALGDKVTTTVYGGTVTLNEDGSADVLADEISFTLADCAFYTKLSDYNNCSRFQFYNYLLPSGIHPLVCNRLKNVSNQPYSIFNNGIYIYIAVPLSDEITTQEQLRAAYNDIQILAPTKDPQTYHFPNVGQLKAFLGTNNIWSDIGNVNVKYLTQNSATGLEYRGDRALELRRRAMIGDAPTIHTTVGSEETGGLASFKSYIKAPVKKIEIPFGPKQDLHGMPYPYPAGASVNLIPDGTDTENGYVAGRYLRNDNTTTENTNFYISEYFAVDEAATYTWSNRINAEGAPSICFYDENKEFISGININQQYLHTFTPPAGSVYARSSQTTYNYQAAFLSGAAYQLEVGSTATEYKRHSNICPINGYNSATLCDEQKNSIFPGRINFNQLATTDVSKYTKQTTTLSFEDGVFTVSPSSSSKTYKHARCRGITPGHIYFLSAEGKNNSSASAGMISFGENSRDYDYSSNILSFNVNSFVKKQVIRQALVNQTSYAFRFVGAASASVVLKVKNFILMDLTEMFGADFAHSLLAMETAEAGTGIAVVNALFPKEYYEYNAGEITTVSEANGFSANTIPITFTDPSTGDPMTIYGGTVTINPDGSVDVVAEYVKKIFDGSSDEPWGYTASAYGGMADCTLSDMKKGVYFNDKKSICNIYKKTSGNGGKYTVRIGTGENSNSIYLYNLNTLYGISNTATLKAWLAQNPFELTYKLDNPVTYHFSNLEQLKVWLGENNFWCDISDDITVKYWNRG